MLDFIWVLDDVYNIYEKHTMIALFLIFTKKHHIIPKSMFLWVTFLQLYEHKIAEKWPENSFPIKHIYNCSQSALIFCVQSLLQPLFGPKRVTFSWLLVFENLQCFLVKIKKGQQCALHICYMRHLWPI